MSTRRLIAILLSLSGLGTGGIGRPAVAAETSIKFAASGDIANTSNSAAVARLIRSQNAQFMLMIGDVCAGTQPIAQQVNANYGAEHAAGKLWPALGNHDIDDPCGGGSLASGYRAYFTLPNNERYYSFTIGPVNFFVVNSHKEPDGTSSTSKQGAWLKGKLAASTSPWKIVYFHHPPYSSGHSGSTPYMQWPFEKWGADAVLSGHDHDYERILKDVNGDGVKIPYFVSGLGGQGRGAFSSMIVSGSVKRYRGAYGAMFITASSTSIRFEFRNTSGVLIDSYSRVRPAKSSPAFRFKYPPK